MLTYIFLVTGCAFVYRALRRRPQSNFSHPPATRSQCSGDEGEAAVQTELHAALQWLCGDNFYLHPGPLLLNHAPGGRISDCRGRSSCRDAFRHLRCGDEKLDGSH
ncbi:hypothetical protein QFZ89_007875 [Paraburkholderia youngii]